MRKTYRGATLEELVPTIRGELGPDAVITRQREGILGGIGGFFGKRCVEVEAWGPDRGAEDEQAAPADPPAPSESLFLATLRDQASPFAGELARAEREGELAGAGAYTLPLTNGSRLRESAGENGAGAPPHEVLPEPAFEAPPPPRREAPDELAADAVRRHLEHLALPDAVLAGLARTIEREIRPFAPAEPVVRQVQRALAQHIGTRHWRGRRRTIALVGAPGCGKTLTAAKLCTSYARVPGLRVAALSLEPARRALALAGLVRDPAVPLCVAESPPEVALGAEKLRRAHLVVVDTPAVSPDDPDRLSAVGALLAALAPDETHLLLPAATDVATAHALFRVLVPHVPVDRLLLTRLDEGGAALGLVSLCLSARIPVSYTSERDAVDEGLRPSEPAALARLVLP